MLISNEENDYKDHRDDDDREDDNKDKESEDSEDSGDSEDGGAKVGGKDVGVYYGIRRRDVPTTIKWAQVKKVLLRAARQFSKEALNFLSNTWICFLGRLLQTNGGPKKGIPRAYWLQADLLRAWINWKPKEDTMRVSLECTKGL